MRLSVSLNRSYFPSLLFLIQETKQAMPGGTARIPEKLVPGIAELASLCSLVGSEPTRVPVRIGNHPGASQ